MAKPIDHTGKIFGRLTVAERLPDKGRRTLYRCVCACGATTTVASHSLATGCTKSCGCLKRESTERNLAKRLTHGLSNTPEYSIWSGMWKRTTNSKCNGYEQYRNKVPESSWADFQTFYNDVGRRPSPLHSLDRIDNTKPYGPGNCRWATGIVQNNNKRTNLLITFKGRTQTCAQWAREIDIADTTLNARIRNGWSIERALTEPLHFARRAEPRTSVFT